MNGYTQIETREIPSLKAQGTVYKHESGAMVFHLKRGDDDKLFSATFRTPVTDDTGVPHIVEHCVLSGSKRYPAKDTFGELEKGSLYTFLNACTFGDFTMYPVSSRNAEDFYNLVSVYMDAVFAPLIYEREAIFRREGWHFETDGEELAYNGIVYSEMKGAFSDPNRTLYSALNKGLFPEASDRFESGGDPKAIPTLTYEKFLEFHRRHYSPSNALLYFYGDMDIEPYLKLCAEWLNERANAGAAGETHTLKQPPASEPVFVKAEYHSPGDDAKNHLAAAYMADIGDGGLDYYGLLLLGRILMKTEASPLKKYLVDKHLGAEIDGEFEEYTRQNFYLFICKDSDYDAQALKVAIDEGLSEIIKNGIDPELVRAVINRLRFEAREEAFEGEVFSNKQILYNLKVISGWHTGGDLFSRLNFDENVDEIERRGTGYFMNLLNRFFIDNKQAVYVTVTPNTRLGEKLIAEEKATLAQKRSELSDEEFESVRQAAADLKNDIETKDSDVALEKIPMLSKADVREFPPIELASACDLDGVNGLATNLGDCGVTYAQLLFDTWDNSPALGAALYLLGKLDTKKRGYQEIATVIYRDLGGWEANIDIFVKPVAVVDIKTLDDKAAAAFALTAEILTETRFDDKARVYALLSEYKAKLENEINSRGHMYAAWRAESFLFATEAWRHSVRGLGFYVWLCGLLADFDARFEDLKLSLEATVKSVFNKSALTVSINENGAMPRELREAVTAFAAALTERNDVKPVVVPNGKAEGIIIPSQVNYCAAAYDYNGHMSYNGRLIVLSGVLRNNWLLPELRLKGGAYGYWITFKRTGSLIMESYRDPNLANTYDVYAKTPGFIESFTASDREMTKAAIGAINPLDKPFKKALALDRATRYYRLGVTEADLRREREEILSTTEADIRDFAAPLAAVLKTPAIATVGAEQSINENTKLFESVVRI